MYAYIGIHCAWSEGMNHFLRLAGFVAVGTALLGSAFALGCAADGDDENGAQESDIQGSLGNAQACAVRDAYARATVRDFKIITAHDLPFPSGVPTHALRSSYAVLEVPGIGSVYYVEYTVVADGGADPYVVVGTFRDTRGQTLLRSAGSTSRMSFYSPAGPLVCGGASSSSSSSSSGSSGSSSGCFGAGCVPEGGASSSGWTPPPGCWGAGCIPEAGAP